MLTALMYASIHTTTATVKHFDQTREVRAWFLLSVVHTTGARLADSPPSVSNPLCDDFMVDLPDNIQRHDFLRRAPGDRSMYAAGVLIGHGGWSIHTEFRSAVSMGVQPHGSLSVRLAVCLDVANGSADTTVYGHQLHPFDREAKTRP